MRMYSINKYLLLGMASLIVLLILTGGVLSTEGPVVVDFMIDINAPPYPTPEEKQIAFDSIVNLTNGIDPKGLNVTLFPVGEAILSQRLHITYLANASNYEVAMGGMKKDEKLSANSSSEQRSLLSEMKKYVEACHICDGKSISPSGFKPQSFDQNVDTYTILDQMGMLYDAGFKAGLLYLPGHEKDTWPYRINNLNVYAVPISTYNLSGELIYLSDRFAKEEKKLSGSQWYDILVSKFDESAKNGDPEVVIFDNQVTGRDADYLDAYLKFIDYSLSKNAVFVTTSELVNMTKAGKKVSISPGMTKPSNATESVCTDCDTTGNVSINIASENATLENRTAQSDVAFNIKTSFED